MSPNALRIGFFLYMLALRLIFWLVIFIFLRNSYYYVLDSELIKYLENFRGIEKNIVVLWEIFKVWLNDLLSFSINLVIIFFIRFLSRNCPVPSKTFVYWDAGNYITPIFGRLIAKHLRTNYYISFQEFCNLYGASEVEKNYLEHHIKKNKMVSFLEKYDRNYLEDTSKR